MAETKRKKNPLEHLKPKDPVRHREKERDQKLTTRTKHSRAKALVRGKK
jgi:hypothetical protein